MARVFRKVKLDGTDCEALFDSEIRGTYVTSSLVAKRGLNVIKTKLPLLRSFGKHVKKATEIASLDVVVDERSVPTHAIVIDEIPVADFPGEDVDILFGVLTMLQWGIRLDSKQNCLELSQYTQTFEEPPASRRLPYREKRGKGVRRTQSLNDQEWAEFQEKTQVECAQPRHLDNSGHSHWWCSVKPSPGDSNSLSLRLVGLSYRRGNNWPALSSRITLFLLWVQWRLGHARECLDAIRPEMWRIARIPQPELRPMGPYPGFLKIVMWVPVQVTSRLAESRRWYLQPALWVQLAMTFVLFISLMLVIVTGAFDLPSSSPPPVPSPQQGTGSAYRFDVQEPERGSIALVGGAILVRGMDANQPPDPCGVGPAAP